jgi:signal peptidase I
VSGAAEGLEAFAQAGEGDPLELFAELLGRGLPVTVRARGGSMRPALQDGDVLTVAPLSAPPRVGEVVAARRGALLALHRVQEVRAGAVRLCGDACARDDGLFDAAELLGKVVAARRGKRLLGGGRLGGLRGRLLGALRPLTRLFLRARGLIG